MEHAIRVAREALGAKAVALNPGPSLVDWQTHGIEQDAMLAHLRQRGAENCEAAREYLEAVGVPCRVVVQLGEPAEEIVREALANGCDRIIVGRGGHWAIAGFVLHSAALKVTHLSELPVTLVK